MSLETEIVLDRRQLRRRLTLWRGLAITGLALAIGAYALSGEKVSALLAGDHIARIAIEGTIMDDRDQLKMLKKIKEADNVSGVLVFVNSPGGTTTGGEALYEELRVLAEKKPVVAQFGTVAASAGYIVGLAADHIVARGNTITGSVGVLMQWPEVVGLMDKVGVKMNEIKSGELKASPSPFAPADEASKAVVKEMIDDGFQWFKGLVESRRGIKVSDVPGLEKGRIFSGRDAKKSNLIDEIGGEEEARKWLEEKKGVAKDLKIIDWKPEKDEGWGLSASASALGSRLATGAAQGLAEMLARGGAGGTSSLDGLISVWHPGQN